MKKIINAIKTKNSIIIISSILFIAILFAIPTGFEKQYKNEIRIQGKIIDTDNSSLHQYGIVKQGEQNLIVEVITENKRKLLVKATNLVQGNMELDKVFSKGDKVLVILTKNKNGEISEWASVSDFWRLDIEIVLLLGFALLLIFFAGAIGIRALLSFIMTALSFWKLLIPAYLKGFNPIIVAILVISICTIMIQLLIGGWSKKTITAISGSLAGMGTILSILLVFAPKFRLHGAIQKFSETLLYSGFPNLDLTGILYASIFIGAMGAIMDLSMDIAAAQEEIVIHSPEISMKELIKSGMRVGKAVLGTMSTTLLFAYSSSYIPLLMIFMSQGVPIENAINLQYVAVEILYTMAGSIGLVLVTPATAVIGGFFMAFPNKIKTNKKNRKHSILYNTTNI
ncbi:YibE/F family protein [Spirochaetia bacterium 38H-sp]|uniref:YibE/F family protein n=1 Tax=Rarispira pelagica TaxID=3141764 RepID=A0ABU9U8R5_9SPIR